MNVRAEMDERRSLISHVVDSVGRLLARPILLLALVGSNVVWVALNLGIAGANPWDPPPFTLLATITSALAPILTLMILMRQHRDARVAELREEIDVQLTLHIEREVTRVARMLDEVRAGLGIETEIDREARQETKSELDPEELLDRLRQQLDESEGNME